MSNVFIQDSTMTAIGDAIRAKTGGTDKLLPADMAAAISGITTGGGDSGDSENGIITLAGFTGLPSYTNSNPVTGTVSVYIPKGATLIAATLNCDLKSGSSTVGTIKINPCEYTMSETDASNSYPGYKKVSLLDYSVANNSGGYVMGTTNANVFVVAIPDAYIKDGILYAGATCEGVLPVSSAIYPSTRRHSLHFEGLDLRGSQVRFLPESFGRGCTELKKIWLSEVFLIGYNYNWLDYVKTWLEELHFTATTPATVSSAYAFDGLSTSCKIYVPSGTLSAYTSAANYPSASKYTYIEE